MLIGSGVSGWQYPQKCYFLYLSERPLQQSCTTVQTVISYICICIDRSDRTGTVSGTVRARNNVGSVWSVAEHFLFRCQNMLSIFSALSETVAAVSVSAPPTVAHMTLSRHQSHHVTNDAGHQQTRLLMLAMSRWLCV